MEKRKTIKIDLMKCDHQVDDHILTTEVTNTNQKELEKLVINGLKRIGFEPHIHWVSDKEHPNLLAVPDPNKKNYKKVEQSDLPLVELYIMNFNLLIANLYAINWLTRNMYTVKVYTYDQKTEDFTTQGYLNGIRVQNLFWT